MPRYLIVLDWDQGRGWKDQVILGASPFSKSKFYVCDLFLLLGFAISPTKAREGVNVFIALGSIGISDV